MKKTQFINKPTEKFPNFLFAISEDGSEYVIHLGSFPCVIKLCDYEYIDDQEAGKDEDGDLIDASDGDGEFHLEIMKVSTKGLVPIGVEQHTKIIKDLINKALDFFVALEKDDD